MVVNRQSIPVAAEFSPHIWCLVLRILSEAGIPPVPEDDIDTWDNFLKRHAATLWECDFCTKRLWTLRGPVDLRHVIAGPFGLGPLRRARIQEHPPAPEGGPLRQLQEVETGGLAGHLGTLAGAPSRKEGPVR